MVKLDLFDLEKHFAFYGAYHSNPTNVVIHMFFVWPIFFSAILILNYTPSLFNLPHLQFSSFGIDVVLVFNIGFLITLIYSVVYICFDWKAGSLAAFLCFVCWVVSSFLATHLRFSLAWKIVLVVQLVSWTGQFVGHGIFERRAPALMDNLLQAFLMAPFFVCWRFLQALQILSGYEPYPGFHVRVTERMHAEIKEWHEKKEKLLS